MRRCRECGCREIIAHFSPNVVKITAEIVEPGESYKAIVKKLGAKWRGRDKPAIHNVGVQLDLGPRPNVDDIERLVCANCGSDDLEEVDHCMRCDSEAKQFYCKLFNEIYCRNCFDFYSCRCECDQHGCELHPRHNAEPIKPPKFNEYRIGGV